MAAFLGLMAVGAALAQGAPNYPARAVSVVVPYAAGGPADLQARLLATKLAENLHQSFVLDFKPGAGGAIGAAFVAKAPADGYTLLISSGGFNVYPSLVKKPIYDPVADFAPVSLLTKRSSLFVVRASLPVKSVAEYIAYARANPNKLNFGTPGLGSGPHLGSEWFHQMIDAKVTYVHYKGTAQMVLDLVSGRVDTAMTVPAGLLAQIRSGKLRLLGVTGLDRSPLLPDVPTVAEQGVPGFDFTGGLGVLAPRGTPPAVVTKLSAEIVKVSREPDVFKRLADDGNEQKSASTPEEFRRFIVAEVARWKKVVQDSGIPLED